MLALGPLACLLALAAPAAGATAGRDPSSEQLAALERDLARDVRSPRGIVALARIADLATEAPDLARVAADYARAANDGSAHPDVRALARWRLARLERSRGSFQKSAAHLRRLGFVSSWKIVGPFDDEGKRGFGAAYPPEQGIDLAARMPGKEREVAWRDLPEEAVEAGFVHLGATLVPSREVVAYALAVVEARRDERVVLRFGASGAAKVFVNGALAIADPGYHQARLDQRGAAVSLRRGPNRILVKLCHSSGRMGFFLRLADARGEGIAISAGDPAAAPPRPGQPPAKVPGALEELERRAGAARGRAEAEARMELAVALDELRTSDETEERAVIAARRAAELEPRSVEARLLAAKLEREHGPRRAQIDQAIAASPEDPRAQPRPRLVLAP